MSDAQCTCLEVLGEDPDCVLHGFGTDHWAQAVVDDPIARSETARKVREHATLEYALTREVERRREAEARLAAPDYVYDPDDWETTYPWDDKSVLAEERDELRPGTLKRYETLIKGPDRWAAHVVIARDEEGDPVDIELRWFDTEEEARAALAPADRQGGSPDA